MGLYYEDYASLEPGHRWMSPGRTVSEADIMAFAGLTGDFHPLHVDAHFAAQSAYGERIAHGYLTASLAAGLAYRVGLDEGTAWAFLSTSWRFGKPVLIGDTLRVEVELVEVRPSRSQPHCGVVVRRYHARNQRGEPVATGDVALLCLRRPD